jgi:predicted dehydrogenase
VRIFQSLKRSGVDDKPLVPANDSAMLLVEFENGAHGTIHFSAVALIGGPSLRQQTSIVGEAGTLEVELSAQGQAVRGVRKGQDALVDLSIPPHLWPEDDGSAPFA